MLIVKSKLAKYYSKSETLLRYFWLIFDKCNFEQTYLLAKKENYNFAHSMVEKFEKSWVLLIYLSQLSPLLEYLWFTVVPKSSHHRWSIKKPVFKRSIAIFTGKHLLIKFINLFYKETPTQVFSCEYCRIFKNT